MGLALGLDIGTTTLSVVLWDGATGQLAARRTAANTVRRQPSPGRAELDMAALCALIVQTLAEAVAQVGPRRQEIGGSGTGRM